MIHISHRYQQSIHVQPRPTLGLDLLTCAHCVVYVLKGLPGKTGIVDRSTKFCRNITRPDIFKTFTCFSIKKIQAKSSWKVLKKVASLLRFKATLWQIFGRLTISFCQQLQSIQFPVTHGKRPLAILLQICQSLLLTLCNDSIIQSHKPFAILLK